tara:strand:+ start:3853 stop:4890 length:1038 start_codon:yes stop_codon:yes gene_type:complete
MTSYRSDFISCDFDFDAPGKHYGSVHLDYSNDAGVSRVFPIPIISINNGDGPTALLTAGNHGNEDEGQLILRRLIADISPENVQGRIIALPALNYPAVRANTRTSPLDGGNLNRCFPANEVTGPTDAIARFVVDVLLPLADAGVDFHAGGACAKYVNTTFLYTCEDTAVLQKSFELAKAFNAPYMYVVDGRGSPTGFDPAAHAAEVPFISTELGGGWIDQEALEVGYQGVRNVLAHLGVIATSEVRNESGQITYLDARKFEGVVYAPHEGLLESRVDLGEEVEAGQTAGVLYSLDEVDKPSTVLKFPTSGIVCAKHISARVVSGTRTYITVKAVPEETILMPTTE